MMQKIKTLAEKQETLETETSTGLQPMKDVNRTWSVGVLDKSNIFKMPRSHPNFPLKT